MKPSANSIPGGIQPHLPSARAMHETRSKDITRLLHEYSDGRSESGDKLLRLVYEDLRVLANSQMRRERDGHTIQPTALVHELWGKLFGSTDRPSFATRRHFFAWVSKVMGSYLKDYARHKSSQNAGGGRLRVTLVSGDAGSAVEGGYDLIDTVDAIETLSEVDEIRASVVRMRAFAGCSYAEIAENLDLSEKQVDRYLRAARLWLAHHLLRPEE